MKPATGRTTTLLPLTTAVPAPGVSTTADTTVNGVSGNGLYEPASTATAQSWLADRSGGNYALVMAGWMAAVAVVLALLAWLGPEVRGTYFGRQRS